MTGGGSAKPKLPPLQDPVAAATPEEINLKALEKGEAERRRLKSRKGRRGTILTEAALDTEKKTILGA